VNPQITQIDADEEKRRKRREREKKLRARPGGHRREYFRRYMRSYQRKRTRKAIDYKGGKCQICGYARSQAALVFHHRDPKAKEGPISRLLHKPWNAIKSEIDKCDLLCANCHAELHEKLICMDEASESTERVSGVQGYGQ